MGVRIDERGIEAVLPAPKVDSGPLLETAYDVAGIAEGLRVSAGQYR